MQIGDTACERLSKTAQSSTSCSDVRTSAASSSLCTFPKYVPISEEAQTASSWWFNAYAGGKGGLACYLARTWIRTLSMAPYSGWANRNTQVEFASLSAKPVHRYRLFRYTRAFTRNAGEPLIPEADIMERCHSSTLQAERQSRGVKK